MRLEGLLLTVLVQLVVIIATARGFAVLFRRLRQPIVVGEIVAGIVLGPSVLGRFFPSLSAAIFHPSANDALGVLSQLGLILLVFLVGLDFDFSHLRWHGKAALAISLSGVALPFSLSLVTTLMTTPLLLRLMRGTELEPYIGESGFAQVGWKPRRAATTSSMV